MKPENACPVCGKDKGRNKLTCSWACNSALRSNRKTCVVCGKPFLDPPTNKTKCCSPECSSINRKNKTDWVESMQKAHVAFNKSELCQPGENHFGAKTWIIKSPSGKIYECRNLLHFIRENAELFDGSVRQAWDGITKIKYTMQGKRKFPSHSWKGWTLIEFGD